MKNTLVIGLTGGIGSGKSVTADLFKQLGTTVIDADKIAREVIKPHTKAYQQIISKFGSTILQDDQQINRKLLREVIFKEPQNKLWLEALLHPEIRTQLEQAITKVTTPYCIVVVPLLIEKHPYPLVDRILVIDAEEKLQLSRAMERDSADSEQILSIIASQASRARRLELADEVITNTGSINDLKAQVLTLHHKYLSLAKPSNK
ncbi:MAG: dephospho-CoA kinase [Gammaproteobacteria bacterium RIFCSPHIGHO2_12_FULL_35_23]|nr:MAG: dephospho-CoA kinase [Gammaproteobacteria bacterium RIFCSPHIGHO2_12_FULL_35_23]